MAVNVKIFRHSQTGAPTLTGQVGSLKTLLDACLLSTGGYNTKSVTSISVDGTEATVSCTGHGYLQYDTIVVSGVTGVTALNDEWQISEIVDTDSFKFLTTETGSPAGTISAKIAPGGWTADYTGTNKSTYKAATGNQYILHLDDTIAQYGTIQIWEGATDVDTSTGFATGNRYWKKSTTSDATARNWTLFLGRDEEFFFFFSEAFASYPGRPAPYYFGEFEPYKTDETYNTMYGGHTSGAASHAGPSGYSFNYLAMSTSATYAYGNHFFVSLDDTTVSPALGKVGLTCPTVNHDMSRTPGRTYPSDLNGGVNLTPIFIWQYYLADYLYRGVFPGLYSALENVNGAISTGAVLTIGGKKYYPITHGGSSSSYYCTSFIDLDGPWV